MKCLLTRLRRFFKEEDGPSTVEYAVLLMLIFLAVIGTVQVMGNSLADSFDSSSQRIEDATTVGS